MATNTVGGLRARRSNTNNYFRIDGQAFFFDAADPVSAATAFSQAKAFHQMTNDKHAHLVCYRPFTLQGPWVGMDLVGYLGVSSLRGEGEEGTNDDIRASRRRELVSLWASAHPTAPRRKRFVDLNAEEQAAEDAASPGFGATVGGPGVMKGGF